MATAVVFFYTACRKSETKPDAKTVSAIDTSNTKIAFNLMQGLSGVYGGANINDGVKAESNITDGQSHGAIVFKKVPLCGFTIDTTFNTKAKSADSAKMSFPPGPAANIIPSEVPKRIFLVSKFSTTTTRRPTKLAGS